MGGRRARGHYELKRVSEIKTGRMTEADKEQLEHFGGTGCFQRSVYMTKRELCLPGAFRTCTILQHGS